MWLLLMERVKGTCPVWVSRKGRTEFYVIRNSVETNTDSFRRISEYFRNEKGWLNTGISGQKSTKS